LFLGNERTRTVCFLLLLIWLTLIGYFHTFNASFNFDDTINITDNAYIRVAHLSAEKLYNAAFKSVAPNRPLANITLALNYYVGQYNTFGYHLVNILIHLINGILIFFFIRVTLRINKGPSYLKDPGHSDLTNAAKYDIPAFLVALIWMVHPIQIQSVTYIVQRMNSLAAMFYLLSLLLYIKGRLNQMPAAGRLDKNLPPHWHTWPYFTASAIACIMGLGTKEILVTLPLVAFLYEWYFFQQTDTAWLRKSFKYILAIVIVSIAIGMLFMGKNPISWLTEAYKTREFTLPQRLWTELRIVILYIGLLLYPNPNRLQLDYDFPISHGLFNPMTTFYSLLLIASLIFIAIAIARKARLISFFILWFFITLSVESTFIPLELVYEHRTYLPSIGFIFIFVSIILYLAAVISNKASKPANLQDIILWFIFTPIVALLILATYQRNEVWRDEATFWKHEVTLSPNKARPHLGLGRRYEINGQFDKAISEYETALKLNPFYPEVYLNLGNIYSQKIIYDKAIWYYTKAIGMAPDYAPAFNGLGSTYASMGKLEEAAIAFKQAIKFDPSLYASRINIGNVYERSGNFDNAIHEYRIAEELDPNAGVIYKLLGRLYAKKNMIAEAGRQLEKAVQLVPNDADSRVYYGINLATRNRVPEALEQYNAALRINPNSINAHYNLGTLYQKMGRFDSAQTEFEKVQKIDPRNTESKINLSSMALGKGLFNEAFKLNQEVLKIDPKSYAAHFNLGGLYMKTGELVRADAEYRAVLKVKPDFVEAYVNLGDIYRFRGDTAEAAKMYRKALEIRPKYPPAMNNLNILKKKPISASEAQAQYKKVVEANVTLEKSIQHYHTGNSYLNQGLIAKAEAEYKEALSIQPNYSPALNNLALVYMKKGEYAQALPLLKKKVELQPNIPDGYYNLASLYALQNKKEEATSWLDKAVKRGLRDWNLIKTDPDLNNIRGTAYYQNLIKGK
ncbi:MAG: tetratricopeptide repeat protein, partial [Syntrophales bacterium]